MSSSIGSPGLSGDLRVSLSTASAAAATDGEFKPGSAQAALKFKQVHAGTPAGASHVTVTAAAARPPPGPARGPGNGSARLLEGSTRN